MRIRRALTIATTIAVALPSIAAAQRDQFRDSWFWGVKAGGMGIADASGALKQVPLAGIEWMITRQHGGLYVSASQAFFTQSTFTAADPSSPDSGLRSISLKNMRRLDVAIVGFPGEHVKFHPYAGIGFTLVDIADAEPQGPFSTIDQLQFSENFIQEQKAAFEPMALLGAQYRLQRFSVFGQTTLNSASRDFLLYNGRQWSFSYELGLRYNVGTSISRD
ncbi:MAG: hypothetical protein ACHQWU_17025 [Gemmatimonadales bacterium]